MDDMGHFPVMPQVVAFHYHAIRHAGYLHVVTGCPTSCFPEAMIVWGKVKHGSTLIWHGPSAFARDHRPAGCLEFSHKTPCRYPPQGTYQNERQ